MSPLGALINEADRRSQPNRCMCGGWIRPITSDAPDIVLAVLWHNRTPRHEGYRTGRPVRVREVA